MVKKKIKNKFLIPLISLGVVFIVFLLGFLTNIYQNNIIKIIAIVVTSISLLAASIFLAIKFGGKEKKTGFLKTKPSFVYFLGFVSISGVIFGLINLGLKLETSGWSNSIILILLGSGLLWEGLTRTIIKLKVSSFKKDVIVNLTSVILGTLILTLGVIILPIFLIPITGSILVLVIVGFFVLLAGIVAEMIF